MTKEAIFLKLQDILSREFELDAETITLESRLYDDLELDSIDAVDLMVKMKGYVREKIEAEQFKNARTIQDVVDLLYPLIKDGC